MTMLPAFSAVIPAFNEASRIDETLRLTLDYLRNASPESELIVVNDGSTDATSLIAREALEAAKIETRLLENFPNRGKGAAVRLGLLAVQKPIALFFDAELLYLAQRAGLRIREIPVRWNHSEGSKVHFIYDSLRMLREVIVLRTQQ